MDSLDGFKLVERDGNELFATVRGRLVTFSKGVGSILGNPSHVHLFVDDANGRFAIKACEKDDGAFSFYQGPKKANSQVFTRLTFGDWIDDMISEFVGEVPKNGFRVYGEYSSKGDAVIFDFHNTSKPRLTRKKRA